MFVKRLKGLYVRLPSAMALALRVIARHMSSERQRCLELFEGAAGEEVKAKYLELAKRYHPDAAGDNAAFHELRRCYEVLSRKEPDWLRQLREDYATTKDPFP